MAAEKLSRCALFVSILALIVAIINWFSISRLQKNVTSDLETSASAVAEAKADPLLQSHGDPQPSARSTQIPVKNVSSEKVRFGRAQFYPLTRIQSVRDSSKDAPAATSAETIRLNLDKQIVRDAEGFITYCESDPAGQLLPPGDGLIRISLIDPRRPGIRYSGDLYIEYGNPGDVKHYVARTVEFNSSPEP